MPCRRSTVPRLLARETAVLVFFIHGSPPAWFGV
nr:MAG TPA: hypothetical protein [Caudoviricetes sp.]